MGWLENLVDIASVVFSNNPAQAAQRANQRITQRMIRDSIMNPKQKQQVEPAPKLTRVEIGKTAAAVVRGGESVAYFRVQSRSCIHYTPKDIVVEFYNPDRRCVHREIYSHRELAKDLEADVMYEI